MILILPKKNILLVYRNKLLKQIIFSGRCFNLSELNIHKPIITENKTTKISIEDLEIHPMNLTLRWAVLNDLPKYKPSDHQKRLIFTIKKSNKSYSYIVPKFIKEKEALACITTNRKSPTIPFDIEIFEHTKNKIRAIAPQKINNNAKILLCTQILGHVQDAAKILLWSKTNKSLHKWNLALPATRRTEITKSQLSSNKIPIKRNVFDWSYAGGKDYETGLEYKENFSKNDSFSTIASFVAVNMAICKKIVNGKYAVVSTNFRGESQIFKRINPSIITCGISHTFLNGSLVNRINTHPELPRLTKTLKDVQRSIDSSPHRIAELGGDIKHIDYYWKLCEEKIQFLDCLIYRTFNQDLSIPIKLPSGTQIVQVPMAISDIKISKEKARNIISNIIGKKLNYKEKIIILSGESDDGSFKKRMEEIIVFAYNNPLVHVLTPLNPDDKRILRFNIPKNVHTIGFRKNWRQIISGADVIFIRGSWGEIIDLIFSEAVPIFSSPGTVPLDADHDTTQFLIQISEERACNISLLAHALKNGGAKIDTINKLIVNLNNQQDKYSIKQAIEYALLPKVAKEIKTALSRIPKSAPGCIGNLHEQLLLQKRIFSPTEVEKLNNNNWSSKKELRK